MESTVKIGVIAQHFKRFFPSLRQYPEKYLPLFGVSPENPPPHLAYLCPLCLKNWILAEQVNGLSMNLDFSPDHYPPKSAGGQFMFSLLTCKTCNSEAGFQYDFSLKRKIQEIAFKKSIPNASIPGYSKITDVIGSYPGLFKMDDTGKIEVSLKPNENIHAPFLDQFIEASKNRLDYHIDFTIKSVEPKLVSKALLKTAYLICFECWGYEFVFSSNAELMRQVLRGEAEYPIKDMSQWIDGHLKFQKLPLGLCYILNPPECRSFMVNIVLSDKELKFETVASILIPVPTEDGWQDLARIEKTFLENPAVNLEVNHVRDFMISNNVLNGYEQSWEYLKSYPVRDTVSGV